MKSMTSFLNVWMWIGLLTIGSTAIAEPGLILNEDNSHFFTTRTAEEMTKEGLHAFIDQYENTQVSRLVLSTNSMKASFASTTREPIWVLLEGQEMPEGNGKLWMDNARLLHERGLDPYAIWIDRSREKGITPWLSMRMNDLHDVPNIKSYMHSSFWLEHPEMWRVPNDTKGGYTSRALDYGHPEVRAYAMAFVRELLERYDPDGLELDWMRFGWHFKAGEEAQGAEHLTQFMRDVYQLTQEWSQKRGHIIQLAVRVPAHPDSAKGLGMDALRWAQDGLVDVIVPCPFWTTTDYDIPVELWKERTDKFGKNIIIAPGIEHNSRAYPGAAPIPNDMSLTRGFAASAWYRGADQLYLFNYMDSQTRPVSAEDYRILVEKGLGSDVVNTQPRRIIQTFRDTVPLKNHKHKNTKPRPRKGVLPGNESGVMLPADATTCPMFVMNIGPKPTSGNVTVIVGLAKAEDLSTTQLAFRVNETWCKPLEDYPNPAEFPGTVRALKFQCTLDQLEAVYN